MPFNVMYELTKAAGNQGSKQ